MKTRNKFFIPLIGFFIVFSFIMFSSPDNFILICQDRLLGIDLCSEHLNEKYKMFPAASHFLQISYFDDFGMSIENFSVTELSAASIENKLLSVMTIDLKTDTIVYSCTALEDPENVFVRIENPTVQDIEDNRCSVFDTSGLKSRDDLRCEQIGGNPNHPNFTGCIFTPEDCNVNQNQIPSEKECQTSYEMCKDLGGKVIQNLSCRESLEEQSGSESVSCDSEGHMRCEFSQ